MYFDSKGVEPLEAANVFTSKARRPAITAGETGGNSPKEHAPARGELHWQIWSNHKFKYHIWGVFTKILLGYIKWSTESVKLWRPQYNRKKHPVLLLLPAHLSIAVEICFSCVDIIGIS
jgi:hypothetical protein